MPLYQRQDTGEIIELPYACIWEQDELGYVTLPDGAQAKRQVALEIEREGQAKAERVREQKAIISDALGFTDHQLQEMEADRKAHGFTGVEFRPDPTEPRFYQVHCSSPQVWARYMRHRGFYDRNSRNGGSAPITAEQMRQAEERVRREHPLGDDKNNP